MTRTARLTVNARYRITTEDLTVRIRSVLDDPTSCRMASVISRDFRLSIGALLVRATRGLVFIA